MTILTACIRSTIAAGAASFVFVGLLSSCTGERPAPGGERGVASGQDVTCDAPSEGCPCADVGREIKCGQVEQVSGDRVLCSEGTRICAGTWGACTSSTVRVRSVAASTIHTRALGSAGPCGNGTPNPCDPYCNQYDDAPAGLTLDAGLCVSDGGITVGCEATGGVPVGTCKLPAAPLRTYCAQSGGVAWVLDPNGGCIVGESAKPHADARPACAPAPDNCDYDAFCASGNKCQAFVAGGKNLAVPGIDFTIGQGCGIAGAGGAGLSHTVCNRGTAAWTGGNLAVSVGTSAAGLPTCAQQQAGGPVGNRQGTCTFAIPGGLAPGECSNVVIAPGATCPGVTAGHLAGNVAYVVNDPASGARIVEANTCNNTVTSNQADVFACDDGGSCGSPPSTAVPSPIFGAAPAGTPTGLVSCGGAKNLVVSGSCSAAAGGLRNCQQDFRCDPGTDRCVWNGSQGYFDPAAGGVDLTVGTACGPPPSGPAIVPVCNRGSTTLVATKAAPRAITFHIVAESSPHPASTPDACADLGAPNATRALVSDLRPGECTSFNLGNRPGGGAWHVVVNAGTSPAIAEAPGRCKNNGALFKIDVSPGCTTCTSCDTRISGAVFDPSSGAPVLANPTSPPIPMPGIRVFQPKSLPLPAFTDGVGPGGQGCDSCASVNSPAVTETVTDAAGTFSMSGVTPGANIPITVQSGRWRRTAAVNVTACTANVQPTGTFRMPRGRTDGLGGVADIPKIAVVTGGLESLECLFYKIGIRSEIERRTSSAQPERIQLWRDNGMSTTTTGAIPSAAGLLSSSVLNTYNALIYDCTGSSSSGAVGYNYVEATTAAERLAVRDFGELGGRAFIDHVPAEPLIRFGAAPWPTAMGPGPNVFSDPPAAGKPAKGWIAPTTSAHVLMRDWMSAVGASPMGLGWVNVLEPKYHAVALGPNTTSWIGGQSTNNWPKTAPPGPPTNPPNYALSFSFETPYNGGTCGAPNGHGRVLFNGMHVAPGRKTGNKFPNNCNVTSGLTDEETALVYQLYQLTACQPGGSVAPPPPPPPPPPPSITLTRDFDGVCKPGFRPEWTWFYWQSITPAGSSIEFRVATSDDPSTFPTVPPEPPPAAPITVPIANASGASVLPPPAAAPNWASDANTVDWHLRNEAPGPRQLSKRYLRTYMTFKPDLDESPVLLAWRQQYSCVPME